jgi:2-polyprenyl-3-methyl-5-hydroxy-6-metoxy-1,4-benzoquinol methylase
VILDENASSLPKSANWYSAAPEFGLYGRWPPEIRLSGLERLVDTCSGKSVLDLGTAEGLIAHRFLQRGAAPVHGFDIVPERVTAARRICGEFPGAVFWQTDLSDWRAFRAEHSEHLLVQYDIVLYLGLHHHLPVAGRSLTLQGAAAMSRNILALRTPDACYENEQVAERLRDLGFLLCEEHRNQAMQELGPLRIFQRCEDQPDERQ